MTNNKIQVIYRLSDRVTLMWPVRPNDGIAMNPESFNVYWDSNVAGLFATLLANVGNGSCEDHEGNRSYHKKVVLNFVPSLVPGWDNNVSNYIKLKAVIGGVEQPFEDVVIIAPYTQNGMRLRYPELRTTAIVGFNEAENRFIPVSVDTTGKVKVI
ncbi:MAG: hypothetical protein Q7R33_05200 [Nitrosarchaeum sp.]|nr:hypothetical protein [Nitrosarchaeum sp.]